jgi:hypothetical protein
MAEIASPKLITPSWFLLLIVNQLDGRKPSSWLAVLTGLTQSRFRDGASQRFHSSTLEKIKHHQINLIKESLPNTDIEQFPSLSTGISCPFEAFAFSHQFPLLQSVSKEIDALDQSLTQVSESPTIASIRNITSGSPLLENPIYWLDEDANDLKTKLNECTSQAEAISISNRVSINVFLSFLAACDLEFCSIAFGNNLMLRPLFLDLIPKAHFEIPENESSLTPPKYKRFSLPTRRLLELTHAIFYYVENQEWPEKPASRKSLEDFSHDKIGNYYDGTKKLNYKSYERFIRELRKYLGNTSGAVFHPLLIAALFWEYYLVAKDDQYKLKSVTLYDRTCYKALWELHRQRWANQLHSGKEDWPTWLD